MAQTEHFLTHKYNNPKKFRSQTSNLQTGNFQHKHIDYIEQQKQQQKPKKRSPSRRLQTQQTQQTGTRTGPKATKEATQEAKQHGPGAHVTAAAGHPSGTQQRGPNGALSPTPQQAYCGYTWCKVKKRTLTYCDLMYECMSTDLVLYECFLGFFSFCL